MGDASPLTCEIARWPILCSSSENRRSRLKVDSVIALSQPIRNPPPNTESGRRIKLMRPNHSGCRYARNASEPRKEVMSVAMIVSNISRGGILSVIGKECKLAQRRPRLARPWAKRVGDPQNFPLCPKAPVGGTQFLAQCGTYFQFQRNAPIA